MSETEHVEHKSPLFKFVEKTIFEFKYFLLPIFYYGLIIVLVLYGFVFIKELYHVITNLLSTSIEEMKIIALDFIDMVMIGNLIKMIPPGSWNSFISKDHGYKNENISSGMLKIKISTSIIVVSSIHLLKMSVTPSTDWTDLKNQLFIYGSFLAGALILGLLEYLHIKGEQIEHELDSRS
jgi:uncharacterized protein (TIGR00645 family)